MRVYAAILCSMIAAPVLGATTIVDVTGNASVRLEAGDTLAFEVFSGSFNKNAAMFGLGQTPSTVGFALASSPTADAGNFSVWLGSADGAASTEIAGSLAFHTGAFSGAGYQGLVSLLDGNFQLSPVLAQQIFAGGSSVLTLRNDGPAVTFDLSPYTIGQDLFVSLGGGPLSVGGLVGTVTWGSEASISLPNSESFDTPQGLTLGGTNGGPLSEAPEPGSSVLFLAGGGLLCGLSMLLNRLSRRGR